MHIYLVTEWKHRTASNALALEIDAIDPVTYRAVRPIFTLLNPGSIPTSVCFFSFPTQPNPNPTLTDDRLLPIEVALVKFYQ